MATLFIRFSYHVYKEWNTRNEDMGTIKRGHDKCIYHVRQMSCQLHDVANPHIHEPCGSQEYNIVKSSEIAQGIAGRVFTNEGA